MIEMFISKGRAQSNPSWEFEPLKTSPPFFQAGPKDLVEKFCHLRHVTQNEEKFGPNSI